MKILFDYQILILQKYGGISRYFKELIDRLEYINSVDCSINCYHSVNHYFHDRIKEYKELNGRKWGFFNRINKVTSLYAINEDIDIFHPTYYDPYFLEKTKKKHVKTVVTVYDMIHEIYRGKYPGHLDDTDIIRKELLIKECDHIISISESTKKDILKFYPEIPEDKVSVIPLATSNVNTNFAFTKSSSLPDRYVLFVGERRDYKNFDNFYKALEPILSKDRELYLLCVGGGAFSEKEELMISKYRDRIIQKNVNDMDLMNAYCNALCFVFPSLYEGFGIPMLEAISAGVPVAASNSSSLPEVGGDAALYFDANDIADIQSKLEEVIYNEDIVKKLKINAEERIKHFSWDKTAEETYKCYEKIVG